ncbi:MAG TPA: EamA family transporter [Chitinophagaceae bacterium]|nr:EamA family transporter [Chitinophagaceae bacterium]
MGITLIGAVVLRIMANPFSNLIQKNLALSKQHPLFINFLSYLVLAAFSLVILFRNTLTGLDAEFWIYSVLGGIAGAFGNAFIVKALEAGELSVLGPVNAYKSVVGALLAFILIGELPNAWGFLGIALIIFGSYFVLSTGPGKFSWSILKQPAIRFRLAALVLTGIQAVFDKKIIQHSNLELAFVSWSVFGAFFSFLICLVYKVNIGNCFHSIDPAIATRYLFLCLSIALMTASTNYVFKHMPVGEALALFQISIIISVFLGYQVFNEGGLVKKLIGSCIMITGSLFILLMK